MKQYDAAIVGSGPAGLAAACTLASEGMRVALVDKCAFPREKLCGGLLSGRARAEVEEIFGAGAWGPGIACVSQGVRFLHRGSLLSSVRSPHQVYLADRAAFDAHLFALTLKKGPDVLQGDPVIFVDPGEMTVHFRNREPLQANFILGADGAASRVARSLFPGPFRKHGYGLCFQADVARAEVPDAPDVPEIHFGQVKWGYAWVFPKGETLSVGLGGLLARNPGMKGLFRDFHCRITRREPTAAKSHYIPSGNFLWRPGRENVLLAGDAAGLVEPITGEGIAFALASGKYAARSILEAARLGDPSRAFGLYLRKHAPIAWEFCIARMLRPLVFSRIGEPLFIRELPRAEGIVREYLALIAGRGTFGRLAMLVAAKIARDVLARRVTGRMRP